MKLQFVGGWVKWELYHLDMYREYEIIEKEGKKFVVDTDNNKLIPVSDKEIKDHFREDESK